MLLGKKKNGGNALTPEQRQKLPPYLLILLGAMLSQ